MGEDPNLASSAPADGPQNGSEIGSYKEPENGVPDPNAPQRPALSRNTPIRVTWQGKEIEMMINNANEIVMRQHKGKTEQQKANEGSNDQRKSR